MYLAHTYKMLPPLMIAKFLFSLAEVNLRIGVGVLDQDSSPDASFILVAPLQTVNVKGSHASVWHTLRLFRQTMPRYGSTHGNLIRANAKMHNAQVTKVRLPLFVLLQIRSSASDFTF